MARSKLDTADLGKVWGASLKLLLPTHLRSSNLATSRLHPCVQNDQTQCCWLIYSCCCRCPTSTFYCIRLNFPSVCRTLQSNKMSNPFLWAVLTRNDSRPFCVDILTWILIPRIFISSKRLLPLYMWQVISYKGNRSKKVTKFLYFSNPGGGGSRRKFCKILNVCNFFSLFLRSNPVSFALILFTIQELHGYIHI